MSGEAWKINSLMVERKEKTIKGKSGVVFAIVQKGKILLEERLNPKMKHYGFTIIPSGGVEKGESLLNTLEREIEEEYGCLPKISYYLSAHTQRDGNIVHKRYLFLVTEVTGIIKNREPEKSKHLWVNFEEARNICKHPFTQEFLDVLENFLSEEELEGD